MGLFGRIVRAIDLVPDAAHLVVDRVEEIRNRCAFRQEASFDRGFPSAVDRHRFGAAGLAGCA